MPIPNRQATEFFRIPKGHFFGRRKGATKWQDLGNTPSVTFTSDSTKQTFPSFQDSLATPAYEDTTERTATLNFQTQKMSSFVKELSFVALGDELDQTEQLNMTFTADGPIEVGDVFELGHFMVTVKSFAVTGAGAVVFTNGVHYLVDSQAGLVVVIKLPDTYDGLSDAVITFDRAAYKAKQYQGLSAGNTIEMEFLFRYTNSNGPKEYIRFHRAQLSLDGDTNLVSDTDVDVRQFTCTLFPDPAKPAPGYFTATDLPSLLAA